MVGKTRVSPSQNSLAIVPKLGVGRAALREKKEKGTDPYTRCLWDSALAGGSATAPHAGPAALGSSPS